MLKATPIRLTEGSRTSAAQALRRPEVRLESLVSSGEVAIKTVPEDRLLDVSSAETSVKYEGYLARQEQAVSRAQQAERRRIPDAFPFEKVPGLSREMVQRFSETPAFQHVLSLRGKTSRQYVDDFLAARAKMPALTARQYGVPGR